MRSTVETAHAEYGGDNPCRARWRHSMQSTCDGECACQTHAVETARTSTCCGDSACGAHAVETSHAEHMHAEHMRWKQRMQSTVEKAHAEHMR